MKMVLFSDPHVGIKRYGKFDVKHFCHTRVLDTIKAIEQVVTYAIKNKCRIIVCAGDVFTTRNPSNLERSLVAKQFSRAIQYGIRVVIVPGNHDTGGYSNNFSQFQYLFIEGLVVVEEPTLVNVDDVSFLCVPWVNKSKCGCETNEEVSRYLEGKIVELKKQLIEGRDNFLIGHFSVEGAAIGSEKFFFMGGEETVSMQVLDDKIFKRVVLGHIHKPQRLIAKNTIVEYVGSLVKCDFNERNDKKGFLVLEKCKDKWQDILQPIDDRKFVQVCIDFEKGKSLEKELDKYQLDGVVLKLVIRTSTEDRAYLDLLGLWGYLEKRGVFHLVGTNVETIGEQQVVPGLVNVSMSDEEMLVKYLQVKGVSKDLLPEMIDMGREVMRGKDEN